MIILKLYDIDVIILCDGHCKNVSVAKYVIDLFCFLFIYYGLVVFHSMEFIVHDTPCPVVGVLGGGGGGESRDKY